MKKLNVCLIVFAIVAMAVMFSACTQGGPTDPGRIPKPKVVAVKHVRTLPVLHPDYPDEISLIWTFQPNGGGHQNMTKAAENTFTGNASIQTETIITIFVRDPMHYDGSSDKMCQEIYIENQLIPTDGARGETTFIFGNDGIVRKPGS